MTEALELHPLDAIALAQLPDPDAANEFLRLVASGRREGIAAKLAGLRLRDVSAWRKACAAFDDACNEAYTVGVAFMDDIGRSHVINGTPGWGGVYKTLMQQRDESYSDKQKIERDDTVRYVEVHREQPPEEWEGGE